MPIPRSDNLSSLSNPERIRKKQFKSIILHKNSSDELSSKHVHCSLNAEEALGNWLRCRHFHCDLKGPSFHWWNRFVLSSNTAEPLLMMILETQRHYVHEKYFWQEWAYPEILWNWTKILIPPFMMTFLSVSQTSHHLNFSSPHLLPKNPSKIKAPNRKKKKLTQWILWNVTILTKKK